MAASIAVMKGSEGQVIDLFSIKTCELHYFFVSLQRFVESLNLVLCQESQENQAEQASIMCAARY